MHGPAVITGPAPRRALARLARACVLAALLLTATAAPAAAHTGGGPEASNFQTRVRSVSPPTPGLGVRVVEAGERLEVANRTGRELIVLGYQGEPYLRVTPDATFENRRSSATYLNRSVTADVAIPADADPRAAPVWRRIGSGPVVAFHWHQAHWMGASAPPQVLADRGRVHVISPRWTLQLRQGTQAVTVAGDLRWVPGPAVWPWVALAVALAAAVLLASRSATAWRPALAAGLVLLVAVDVVSTAGLWLGLRSALLGKVTGVVMQAAGWVAGAVAAWLLLRRRSLENALFLTLFAAAMVSVVGGIADLTVLSRSQLVSVLPSALARVLVAAKLGLGVGLGLAALLRLRRASSQGTPAGADAGPDAGPATGPDHPSPPAQAPAGSGG